MAKSFGSLQAMLLCHFAFSIGFTLLLLWLTFGRRLTKLARIIDSFLKYKSDGQLQ